MFVPAECFIASLFGHHTTCCRTSTPNADDVLASNQLIAHSKAVIHAAAFGQVPNSNQKTASGRKQT
jgi:hypothetical protein